MPMVWAAARHQWGVLKLMKVAGVRSGGLFLFQLRRLAYPDVLNTSRARRGQLGAQKGGMYASRVPRVASNRTRTGGSQITLCPRWPSYCWLTRDYSGRDDKYGHPHSVGMHGPSYRLYKHRLCVSPHSRNATEYHPRLLQVLE